MSFFNSVVYLQRRIVLAMLVLISACFGGEAADAATKVRFTIASDGQLLSHQIVEGSTYQQFDQECSRAIARAAPFPPLPNSAWDYSTFIATFTGDGTQDVEQYECEISPDNSQPATDHTFRKPMFDCACIQEKQRELLRNWWPPKDADSAIVSFVLDEQGKARKLHLERSSGTALGDNAAFDALEKTSFDPVQFRLRISATFTYYPRLAVLMNTEATNTLPVKLVSTEWGPGRPDCFKSYTELNNRAVEEILAGRTLEAQRLLEEAHATNPKYFPAIYNLKVLGQRNR